MLVLKKKRLIEILDDNDYVMIHIPEDKNLRKEYQDLWREKFCDEDGFVVAGAQYDPYENGKYYIYQFFGSQKAPDFVVIYYGVVFSLECKSSRTNKIVWNCGVPHKNWIYGKNATIRAAIVNEGVR